MTLSESLHRLVFDRRLRMACWDVYRALRDMRRTGTQLCTPRISQIVKALGGDVSERTVQRALRDLEHHGFVVRTASYLMYDDAKTSAFAHRGRQLSNIYRLTTEEERLSILKGRPEAEFLRPRAVVPRVTRAVTPNKSLRRTAQITLPHDPLPTGNAEIGARPAEPAGKGTHAGLAAGPGDLSRALTFWRAEQRKGRQDEPPALPAEAVAAVEDLLRHAGLARTLAVMRVYRAPKFKDRPGRDWADWAKDADYPLGRLKDLRFVRRLMDDPDFGAVHRKYANDLANEISIGRSGQAIGAIFRGLPAGPPDSS